MLPQGKLDSETSLDQPEISSFLGNENETKLKMHAPLNTGLVAHCFSYVVYFNLQVSRIQGFFSAYSQLKNSFLLSLSSKCLCLRCFKLFSVPCVDSRTELFRENGSVNCTARRNLN